MRRLLWLAVLAWGAACTDHKKEPDRYDWVLAHHDAGALSSTVDIGDPATRWQHLYGIYPPEEKNPWSWTAPDFSVVLAAPHRVLRVKLFLAAPQLDQLKEVTLRARANGLPLPPITYRKPGEHTYVQPLPAGALDRPVKVEFSVDYPFLPKPPDTRKLGIVISSIAIEDK